VKKLKKSNKRVILYIAVAAVLIASLYLINNPIMGNIIGNPTSKYDFSRAANPDYYSLLPPKPSDFDEIKLMFERGIIRDNPERINESYWKQPEWFPNYEKTFLPILEDLIEAGNREPVWSLGIFDAQIYTRINQDWLQNPSQPETGGHGIFEIKEDSIVIKQRFWLRASPGALKYFGVGLQTNYPAEAKLLANAKWGINEETIKQDSNLTQKYIKSVAYEKESGKSEFTLGNYWPKLDPNYIKEIEVEAEINKDIPKGKYVLEVEATAPSREYQESQSLKYGLGYTDPNIGFFRGPSKFVLFIEII